MAVQAGDLAGARARFEERLAIAHKLAKLNPSSAEAQRDLLVSLVKLGQAVHDRALVSEALTFARELERTGRLGIAACSIGSPASSTRSTDRDARP